MGLTDKQIQKRWDANFQAVQDAKQAVADARAVWHEGCEKVGAIYRDRGFRRRYLLNDLTPEDVDRLLDAEDARDQAYDEVRAADALVAEAEARFKAGVPVED